jgi:hypothetical protein
VFGRFLFPVVHRADVNVEVGLPAAFAERGDGLATRKAHPDEPALPVVLRVKDSAVEVDQCPVGFDLRDIRGVPDTVEAGVVLRGERLERRDGRVLRERGLEPVEIAPRRPEEVPQWNRVRCVQSVDDDGHLRCALKGV